MKIEFADVFADETLGEQQSPRIRKPSGTSRPGTAGPGSNTQGAPKCDVKGGRSTNRPRSGNRESLRYSGRSRRKNVLQKTLSLFVLIRLFDTKTS